MLLVFEKKIQNVKVKNDAVDLLAKIMLNLAPGSDIQ